MHTMIFSRNVFVSVCWAVLTFGSFNVVLSKQLCGDALNTVFKVICAEFPTLHDDKRSMDVPFESRLSNPKWYSPYLSVVADAESDTDARRFGGWFPYKYRDAATAGLEDPQDRFRSAMGRSVMMRYRRTIERWTHECCRRSCSPQELASYCKVVAPGILDSNIL